MSAEADQEKQDLDMVRKHVEALSEHWDTAHIFVSRHESGTQNGTINVALGSGNWFARYGQIKSWTVKQDEHTRIQAHEDEDDDSE